MLNPLEDGVTHINIYSRGKTPLGRWLSNFAESPFTHPVHGNFMSVEGFWYWLGTRNEALRNLYGFEAKKIGRNSPTIIQLDEQVFKEEIAIACWAKLWSNYGKVFILAGSVLPFEHYYVFGKTVKDAGFKWLLGMWEQFRIESRKHI